MLTFQSTFEELMQAWQLRLQDAQDRETDLQTQLETYIHICEETLSQLKQWVRENTFPDKVCEIYFFKQVKPVIMARYIYYLKIYRLHTCYINGFGLLKNERLTQELRDIARHFEANEDFYRYYRSGCTHNDELYFVRAQFNWKICPEVNQFNSTFCTNGDGKLAELMAYELLMKYIDGLLNPSPQLTGPAPVNSIPPAAASTLPCTASITDIVELGYALQNRGFFKNGKASIKEVMAFLADALKVDLKNYSQTFYQIRERKNNVTRFIDELKAGLTRYIEQLGDQK
jgi:hypothetical protein